MALVCVGVSGGVDSAAVVMMLKEQGHEVVGLHFTVDGSFCEEKITQLSESLNIKIVHKDISSHFKQKIITPFIQTYMQGGAPSPCVECNSSVKWQVIIDYAQTIGAQKWATGHYVQTIEHNGLIYIAKGKDPLKDQSYYLWKLSQEVLRGMVVPLGDKTKQQIKEYVASKGYTTIASQKESMGLCFLNKGGYKELLRKEVDGIETLNGGDIVTLDGEKVGTHEGYPFYTIAQKKGLDIDKGLSVVDIDVDNNRLIVGDVAQLYISSFTIYNHQFTDINEVLTCTNMEVKVRGVGRNPDGYCTIKIIDNNLIKVELTSGKAWAVTKSQPVVFYIGERVVGGGYACGDA